MRFPSNVHTHTRWCDGANTPMEMAEAALALGFTDLGFSSHTQEIGHPGLGMDVEEEDGYKADVAAARAAFAGRLAILCGAERDTYSPSTGQGFDYLIGSNHYLPPQQGAFIAVDVSAPCLTEARDEWYGGDWKAMVRDFYADSLRNVRENKPAIVGHFDLITKYNPGNAVFPEDDPFYRSTALAALDEVAGIVKAYGGMVEMNMAPVARKLREEPYPSPFLLRHLAQREVRVIVTGDSHKAETLDNAFDKAPFFLAAAGFTRVAALSGGEFLDIPLEI